MMGEWSEGLRYLFPLLAFAVGVFVAERIQGSFKYARKLHWRQSVLLCEMAILVLHGDSGDSGGNVSEYQLCKCAFAQDKGETETVSCKGELV